MCYKGYGYPLTLFLEEGGVVTVCKINTQEPEEPIDFDFCSTNVTNKVNNKEKCTYAAQLYTLIWKHDYLLFVVVYF